MALSKLLQTGLALFIMLANMVHSQDTTSFTFNSFTQNPTNLTYQGDAHVPAEMRLLRLTGSTVSGIPVNSSVGRVLYSRPVKLWEASTGRQANFETTIKFVITPSEYGAADGLAFFIAPVGNSIAEGADAGNLAIFNSAGCSSNIFAVEFDTWSNAWDPSYRHIGIDINSRISYNVTKFDSATGKEVTARISYNGITGTISVAASPSCASLNPVKLSYVFQLKKILPEIVQVGISSSTGKPPANLGMHDIHSWSFTSTLVKTSTNVNMDKETYNRKYLSMV